MEEAMGPEGIGHADSSRVYLTTTTNLRHFSPCFVLGTLNLSSFIPWPSPNVYQPVILIWGLCFTIMFQLPKQEISVRCKEIHFTKKWSDKHNCSISCMRLRTRIKDLDLKHKEMLILLLAKLFIFLIHKETSQTLAPWWFKESIELEIRMKNKQ